MTALAAPPRPVTPATGDGSGRPRRARRPSLSSVVRWTVIAAAVAIVAYSTLVPLVYLLWGTFVGDDGRFSLQHVLTAYHDPDLLSMTVSSALFAGGSTLVSAVFGGSLAYLGERTDAPLRRLITVASLIPLTIPGILHTIAQTFLLSPRTGLVNLALAPLVGPGFFDVFSIGGMAWVEGLHSAPLFYLMMVAAFRSMDPAMEEAALTAGATRWQVLRHVTLPLVRPAIWSAVLVTVVRGLESFEVPAILGPPGDVWVFTSKIWRNLTDTPVDYGEAGAYSLALLAVTTLGVLWQGRIGRGERSYQTVGGKGFGVRRTPLRRWRWVAGAWVLGYVLVAAVLPLLVLVYASTQPFYAPPSARSLSHMSLTNYASVLTDPGVLRALRSSLLLATGTATAVMAVMAVAAWFVVRTRAPLRRLVDTLAFLPLVVPGMVLGVALLFVYLRAPVPVYGTIWILFLAYFTRHMPYGMRYLASAMQQVSGELEESARVSGAGWWGTFRRITLPLIAPGVVAGWIYVAMASLRELSSSILLYSPGSEVLSITIWSQWEAGDVTRLAALGTLMILLLTAGAVTVHRLGARLGVRET